MLLPVLQSLGGIASTRQLAEQGIGDAEVRAAVRRGDVHRLRQGWVALPTADREVASAVRVGGALTCTSLLNRLGLWCAHDGRLHVRVPPNITHLASPSDRTRPLAPHHAVHVHRPQWAPRPGLAIDWTATALALAVVCQPRLDAIVTLDSALQRGLVTRASLGDVLEPLPAKHRSLIHQVDPGSQSGLETKARVSLRGLRVKVRSQVAIPGVGRVDLVVGERLVLELDGHRWHSSKADFEEDRRRDLELTRLGYLGMRLSYDQVIWRWDECEAVILGLVRRREHLWSRGRTRTE